MIPTNVVYQKNNDQGHECFFTLFQPINSKKFFQYFFRNLRIKIHKLKRFHEKENVNCGFKLYQVILSTLYGTCTSTV